MILFKKELLDLAEEKKGKVSSNITDHISKRAVSRQTKSLFLTI